MTGTARRALLGLLAVTLAVVGLFSLIPLRLGAQSLPPIPSNPGPFVNPALSESKTCDTAVNNFTPIVLNLLTPADCTIHLSGPAGQPVADGTVIVKLSPASGPLPAVLSCGTAPCQVLSSGNGVVLPCPSSVTVNNTPPTSTACGPGRGGGEVEIFCGNTAPSGTTPSQTCTSVDFQIESTIAVCILTPTACPPGANLSSATGPVTVEISMLATPGNNGSNAGGIVLGDNTFVFQAPGTGLLLVSATPAAIPANGTLPSVVTATFSCDTTPLQPGFPRSPANPSQTIPNNALQPILNSPDVAICGAGLPGTFTFNAQGGGVLFDNGRTSESVGCGLGANDSVFGGPNPWQTVNPTPPLAFTCMGAAALAIGNGAATGEVPINVVYTSATGGLTAVGSTAITVVPAGTPVLSLTCAWPPIASPTTPAATLAANGQGALCTATVTDQNGVPMGGLTGAIVTFTSSDSSRATVLACGMGLSSNYINLQPKTVNIPALAPTTPCQYPSAQAPAQQATFVNGQAYALVVPTPNAAPGTITITATLGAMIPPSLACMLQPFTATGLNPHLPNAGLPSVTGCGTASSVAFTGLASTLSTATASLGTGPVLLPNATSASASLSIGPSTAFQVAGATVTSPQVLYHGCNQVTLTSQAGAPIKHLVQLARNGGAIQSIWRYNNSTKSYEAGYFADTSAPVDFTTTGGVSQPLPPDAQIPPAGVYNQVTETYFVCVNPQTVLNPN